MTGTGSQPEPLANAARRGHLLQVERLHHCGSSSAWRNPESAPAFGDSPTTMFGRSARVSLGGRRACRAAMSAGLARGPDGVVSASGGYAERLAGDP